MVMGLDLYVDGPGLNLPWLFLSLITPNLTPSGKAERIL